MTYEEIKGEIEKLSLEDKRRLLAEVVPKLSREVLGDKDLRREVADKLRLFGRAAKDVISKKLSER